MAGIHLGDSGSFTDQQLQMLMLRYKKTQGTDGNCPSWRPDSNSLDIFLCLNDIFFLATKINIDNH